MGNRAGVLPVADAEMEGRREPGSRAGSFDVLSGATSRTVPVLKLAAFGTGTLALAGVLPINVPCPICGVAPDIPNIAADIAGEGCGTNPAGGLDVDPKLAPIGGSSDGTVLPVPRDGSVVGNLFVVVVALLTFIGKRAGVARTEGAPCVPPGRFLTVEDTLYGRATLCGVIPNPIPVFVGGKTLLPPAAGVRSGKVTGTRVTVGTRDWGATEGVFIGIGINPGGGEFLTMR